MAEARVAQPHATERPLAAGQTRDLIIIAVLFGAVTLLHVLTPVADPYRLHLLFRRLYYIPILYAAWVFGWRGGMLTGLAAGITYGLHSILTLHGLTGASIDNLYEIILFVVLGTLFGRVRDIEERRTADLRQVSAKLEDAYGKLEERAIQLINIQEYMQSILRSITTGVITVGPDASVATVNPAAERILGMSEADTVPRPITNLFADDGGLAGDVRKVLTGRVPKTVRDVRLLTRSGLTVHAQAAASRMRDVSGRILGAVVTLEDVSEIKSLTDQLIRADRLAAMGELTAGVAHEVRNPLGIIRASVQLLEEAQCKPERIAEASTVIKQEIDRLDKVIKALLDFGRPSKPTLVRTDLLDVLSDVVLFTRRFASRADVEIVERYPHALPSVMADPDQLKQVFVNLISNAVQAMEPSGGTITLAAQADGGFVTVRVEDDGPGMAPEDLSKVFDPFYSRREGGTGLGLTIVHRIVDEHDGHIEVESVPGEGTVFTVSLPAAESQEG